jgi:hypothetical protein
MGKRRARGGCKTFICERNSIGQLGTSDPKSDNILKWTEICGMEF